LPPRPDLDAIVAATTKPRWAPSTRSTSAGCRSLVSGTTACPTACSPCTTADDGDHPTGNRWRIARATIDWRLDRARPIGPGAPPWRPSW